MTYQDRTPSEGDGIRCSTMKGLAPRRDQRHRDPMWLRILGPVIAMAMLFVVVDFVFSLRERILGRSAYSAPTGLADQDRQLEETIRYRIALLLRPRDGKAVIGGDPSARLIEAGLLYGRLSMLQEQHGRLREAAASMSRAVSLLKDAGHPDPTERHIRDMVARQGGAGAPRR